MPIIYYMDHGGDFHLSWATLHLMFIASQGCEIEQYKNLNDMSVCVPGMHIKYNIIQSALYEIPCYYVIVNS